MPTSFISNNFAHFYFSYLTNYPKYFYHITYLSRNLKDHVALLIFFIFIFTLMIIFIFIYKWFERNVKNNKENMKKNDISLRLKMTRLAPNGERGPYHERGVVGCKQN